MTERESLIAAVADRPEDDATRLVVADWLEEHGEAARAVFIRAACQAARARRGSRGRADLLDRAEGLLAEHEAEWLGEWRERLIDWEFRRGFLDRVRLTATTFLQHAERLFRAEPVGRVELVNDANEPLAKDAIRDVVAHPAFAFVRDCAVVPRGFLQRTPVSVWLAALAANPKVTRLRRFTPVGCFSYNVSPDVCSDGIDRKSFAAFCRAEHLRSLRSLNLTVETSERSRPWLVPCIATATFARQLRSLTLLGCGLTADGVRQIASDPAFGGLKTLRLSWRKQDASTWEAIFNSATLTSVNSANVPANLLPTYARSPMARRVRFLSVHCANDLDRDLSEDRRAWLELIERAPPPLRLTLGCHNPGDEVFAAMRRMKWLRKVRKLSISGDSQYEVYAGQTAGVRSLFGRKSLRRLAALKLHEACDRATLATLARWPGLARLESLELTDDYHGRLVPSLLKSSHPPECLRTLRGVILSADEDVERFLALPRLDRLARLHLSFCGDHEGRRPPLPPDLAEQVFRSDRLARVTELKLGFHYLPAVQERLAQTLADPSVLPRLRGLTFYGSFGNEQPSLDGLRARFGTRLQAW